MKNRLNKSTPKALFLAIATLSTLLIAPTLLYAQAQTQAPTAFTSESSARGRQEHSVSISEWGRYALEVKSTEGASLEVVDKLRGAFAKSGQAGGENGRMEIFLEAGEYKVVTEGPPDAGGALSLTVSRFSLSGRSEGGKGDYGYLRPFEQVSAELSAMGARAWWIFVPRDTTVYIEAMGRRLGALAVFRNGEWLAAESGGNVEALSGGGGDEDDGEDEEVREYLRSVRDRQRYGDGYGYGEGYDGEGYDGYGYEGGEDEEGEGDDGGASSTEPDFVNRVVPEKALNGRRIAKRLERGRYLVVAYGGGRDQYTVSDAASPLYVSWMLRPLDKSRQVSAKIGASGVARYAVPSGATFFIESGSGRTLRVEYNSISTNDNAVSSISAASGDTLRSHPLLLTNPVGTVEFRECPCTWMLSISGAPGSAFKITPVGEPRYNYTPKESGEYRISTLHTNFSGDKIGASGVLIDMKDTSIAALRADTVSPSRPARWKFNVFNMLQTSYIWVDEGGQYTVTPGGLNFEWRVKSFYVNEPRNYRAPGFTVGMADVSLNRGLHVVEITTRGNAGAATFTLSHKRGISDALHAPFTSNPSIDIRPVTLEKGRPYRFYMNEQGIELGSVSIERYPAPERENTAAMYLTGEAAEKAEQGTTQSSALAIGAPQYVSLGVLGLKAYGFTISEAGIYKVETMGRLHTKLTARDRFGGLSYSQAGNGVGRNALIAEFFLPGSYMVLAETVGKSAGRMGVVLTKGDMAYGGKMQIGSDSRAEVKANGAVAYDVTVGKKGRYVVESFGQSSEKGNNRMGKRLEDSKGWPLFKHGYKPPASLDLERGSYKLYSLPAAYENYRVTRVEEAKDLKTRVSGMGPHKVSVNEPVAAVWVEGGKVAAPARFLFETAAAAEIKVTLSPDFNGTLYSTGGKDSALIKIDGMYSGALPRGKYEIAVTPKSPRNHQPYELSITTTDLFDGIGLVTDCKEALRVKVGAAGTYEIFSQGKAEVSARLYARDKKTEVARSGGDQRDWNFILTEKLDTGTYYLQTTLGQSLPWMREVKVLMRKAEDTLTHTAKLGGAEGERRRVTLSGKQVVIPIEIPADAQAGKKSASFDVLTLTARSNSNVVCELSAANSKSPIGRKVGKLLTLSAPVEKGAKYTLRIWPEERVNDEAVVDIKTVAAIPIEFNKARSGVTGAVDKGANSRIFYKIDGVDASPGHYELLATENEIAHAAGTNEANRIFEEEEGSIIASAGKTLFVEAAFRSQDKFRFVLSPVQIIDVREVLEKNKRKFETADKYREAKFQIKYTERGELPITIRQNREKVFAIEAPAQKFGVITLSAPTGQPMVGLTAPQQVADFVRGTLPIAGGQYLDRGVCKTAVLPGDTGRVVSWNAQTFGTQEINGALMMTSFTLDKPDSLRIGRTAWEAATATAKELRIAQNSNRAVTIKLSPRTGAVYASPSGKRTMYYGGEDGAEYTIEPTGGKLFLFGAEEGEGAGGIELEMYAISATAEGKRKSPKADELTVGAEKVSQFLIDTREPTRIKIGAQSSTRVYLTGSAESADWISKSGQITPNIKSGHKLMKEGGTLFVNYAAGTGKLALCKDDGNPSALNDCRWGEQVKKDNAPAVKELSRLTMSDGVNWYSVELKEPTHLSLHAPTPAAAVTVQAGKIRDYEEFWDELAWNLPLPAGKYNIGVKPLTGRSLYGVPLTVGFYPIQLLTEEKPIEIQLMASQKRLVKFDILKKGKIGLGMSSLGQLAEASLLDAKGKNIAKGRQIYTELNKGTYYLLLATPPMSTQSGSTVKLYLFGQSTPPAEVPGEVIEWIIKGGTGERPLSAATPQSADNSRRGRSRGGR